MTEENCNSHFNPRCKAQSTSQLLTKDSIIIKPMSSSITVASSPSSTSSLATSNNSSKTNLTSFFKISLSNRKSTNKQASNEDRFVMTFIKSPSNNSPRITPNSSSDHLSTTTITTPTATVNINEDLTNNSKLLKNKVTAAFNHMKYRWAVRMRPNFRTNESPIYLLGKMYNGKEETTHDDMSRPPSDQSYTNFLKSFSQRIYLSYRKQFEPLNGLTRSGDPITSDCGWGCMIRCAQMLLAQTLLVHMTHPIHLPHLNIQISDKYPKRNSLECLRNSNRTNRQLQIYRDIIRLFGDYPNVKCPFGIHKIVEIGTTHGIRPGDFFGPVSAAHCLKEALQNAIENKQIADTLTIYISQDAIVYRQDIIDLCTNSSNWSRSVLILIPLRLGLNELDLIYESYLKEALKLPQTVGIIGGSPRHAVYILGFQDESFIDLDPHFSQSTVNVLEDTFDLSSYSCSSPKKLTAKKMDPSCTLGFYCRDKADFEMFCAQWNHICHMATDDRRTCPIFRIERGTFQESHTRLLTSDYPLLNDDENIFLRVTKLSTSDNNSSLLSINSHQSNKKYSSHDTWDDHPNNRLINDNIPKNTRTRKHSLSDDYVFL